MSLKWKSCKIGDVVSVRRGASPRPIKDYVSETGMPWVKIADATKDQTRFINFTNEFIKEEGIEKSVVVNPGDLIVSNSATPGLPKFMNIKACVHDGWLVFDSYNGILKDFLYYYFIVIRGQLVNQANGSVFKNLKTDIVRNFDINLPDLETQKKIVKILSQIDKKIEINIEINKNLEQLLHTIFNYWFISFDKFKNAPFKESPLGNIPEGWSCGALRDLLTLNKNPIKADKTNGLFYLPIDIIPMNSLGISELKSDEEANSSLITFNKNDILIGAMRVYFHRVVISPCSGVTRSTCFVLKPKNEHHLSYLLLLCNLDRTIQYAQNTSKGTTMPYAVWDNGLGDMDIIIPPEDILSEFHELVFPIIENIRDSYLEINKLSKLRDTLLPKLMSGEIDVSKINCDLE